MFNDLRAKLSIHTSKTTPTKKHGTRQINQSTHLVDIRFMYINKEVITNAR
jgi:hypothetical protein